jgi:hypothetical protein
MWTIKPPLNLQKQVLKNQDDIETLQTAVSNISAPELTSPNFVSYNTTDGATITYDNGAIRLPIKPGNGISIDATNDAQSLEIKVGDTVKIPSDSGFGVYIDDASTTPFVYFDAVNSTMNLTGDGTTWITIDDTSDTTAATNNLGPEITAYGGMAVGSAGEVTTWIEVCPVYKFPSTTPSTVSNGLLPDDTSWNYLKSNSMRVKLYFNKEYYTLADDQHTTGTLVFSHVGYESGQLIVKTITIILATRGWVLSVIKPATHMAIANLCVYSDADKTDIIGNLVINIPCAYSGDIDAYITEVGNNSYILCSGYIVLNNTTYAVFYADAYNSQTGAINLYTIQDTNGKVCYIDQPAPDYINIPQ